MEEWGYITHLVFYGNVILFYSSGIRDTLVHFLAVCVIFLCGYHAGALSMQTQHDPSMLLRFGNQAPVRKDYCDVNPVVLSLRFVHFLLFQLTEFIKSVNFSQLNQFLYSFSRSAFLSDLANLTDLVVHFYQLMLMLLI